MIKKKFIVIEEKVYDFENFLMPYFNRNTKLKISKAVKISYFTNGDISMRGTYSDKFENTVNILNCDIELVKNIDMNKILCIENIGLNPNKEKDLLHCLNISQQIIKIFILITLKSHR